MTEPQQEAVVLIHGLFMNGWDMTLLRQRIGDAGYAVHQFSYHSTSDNIDEIVRSLRQFVDKIAAKKIHYVCHSLGGLVLRHFVAAFDDLSDGHAVTLGTPHKGSRAAESLSHHHFTSMILGESLQTGLLGNVPSWSGRMPIGIISGEVSFGLGMLFEKLAEPNDGTVTVEETFLENNADQIKLPVSHAGLVLSKTVAVQTVYFLKCGKFDKK